MRGIEDTSVLGVGLQSGVGQLGIGYLGVRGEGLDTDGLSLDLQFATDKTLTARKGPTPVFTRASTATFVGSNGLIQSAAVNAPRFDHDPVGLACKGLLIEESRTNLWSASEEIGASPWSLLNPTTVNLDNTASPNGLTTADRLTVGSTTQEYGFFRNTFSFVSGTAYTISFFFKANQITRVNIRSGNSSLLPISAIFDLTGSGSIIGTPTGSAIIQQFSNGWYRCSVSATALLSGITAAQCLAVTGTSTNYPGNSVDSFWAWGAQLEAGSFPTSYIPTTTAALARSADVCSITGGDFTSLYNQSEGTLFSSARIETGARSSNGFIASLYNASSNEFSFRNFSGFIQVVVRDGGPRDFSLGTAVTDMKVAMAYNNANNAGSLNGDLATGVASTLPLLTSLAVGSRFSNSLFANGTIAAIRYFRKRLPNAKLQTLTT